MCHVNHPGYVPCSLVAAFTLTLSFLAPEKMSFQSCIFFFGRRKRFYSRDLLKYTNCHIFPCSSCTRCSETWPSGAMAWFPPAVIDFCPLGELDSDSPGFLEGQGATNESRRFQLPLSSRTMQDPAKFRTWDWQIPTWIPHCNAERFIYAPVVHDLSSKWRTSSNMSLYMFALWVLQKCKL